MRHELRDVEIEFINPLLRAFRELELLLKFKQDNLTAMVKLITAQQHLEGIWALSQDGTYLEKIDE